MDDAHVGVLESQAQFVEKLADAIFLEASFCDVAQSEDRASVGQGGLP